MLPVKILGRHIIFDEIIWLSSSGSEVGFEYDLCSGGEIARLVRWRLNPQPRNDLIAPFANCRL